MFNPFVMIQDKDDRRAWVCGSYETCASFDGAMDVIFTHRCSHVVLCEWITDNDGDTVYFKNYTDVFGMVNHRLIK